MDAAGGIKGNPLQLKQYDDRNDPVEGVTLAKRLGDEVVAVIVASAGSPPCPRDRCSTGLASRS